MHARVGGRVGGCVGACSWVGCVHACLRACLRACVCAYVRVDARACVHVRVDMLANGREERKLEKKACSHKNRDRERVSEHERVRASLRAIVGSKFWL